MTAAENLLTLINLCKPPSNTVQCPAKVFFLTSVKSFTNQSEISIKAELQSIVVVSVMP